MKIVVLVKQVPNPRDVRLDPETRRLVREGVPLELNEFDVYAVTEAIRLREEHGGEVVTMTMGPPQAEEALRATLAMGADRAIHLSDRVFAVADTIGTSRTLALAVEKEGADLVLCGRKTVDSETWQVPPETAAFLGWQQLTNVDRLELAEGGLRARRETDEGFDTYELGLPAVLSVTEGINEGIWPAKRDVDAVDPDDGSPSGRRPTSSATSRTTTDVSGRPVPRPAFSRSRTSPPTATVKSRRTPSRQPPGFSSCWQRPMGRRRRPGRSRSGSGKSPAAPTTAGRSWSSSAEPLGKSRSSSWARAASSPASLAGRTSH